MKRISRLWIGVSVFVLTVCAVKDVCAGGWEEIYQNLSPGKSITSGQEVTASVYNATLTFTITDRDGNLANFAETDAINLRVAGHGKTMTFSGSKTGLIDWATTNSGELLATIFGASPEIGFSGTTNTQYNTQQIFTTLSAMPSTGGTGISFVPVSTKDVVVSGQYDFMEVGQDKVSTKGSSGTVGYERKFGIDQRHSLGIVVPYRQLDADDEIESNAKYVAFVPFYKHRWYGDNYQIEWMVNAAVNVTYLKSAVFPDGGGYFEYGGGTGVQYAHAFTPRISMDVGLMYQALKKEIPSSMVPDELKWVSDSISALPVEQDLTPSIGVTWHLLPEKFSFRGQVFRIHQLQSDVEPGYRNQTVALGLFTYNAFDKVQLSMGYKRSFEMQDLEDQSVILSARIKWD